MFVLKILNYLTKVRKKTVLLLIAFSSLLLSILEIMGIAVIPSIFYIIINIDEIENQYVFFLDPLLQKKDEQLIFYLIFLTGIIFILKNIFIFLIKLFQTKFWMNFRKDITQNIFLYYLKIDYEKFLTINDSQMKNNILNEASYASAHVRDLIILLNEIFFFIFLVFVIIFTQSIYVYLSILLILVFGLLIYFLIKNRVKKYGDEGLSARDKYIKFINQAFGLFKETIIYDKIKYVEKNFVNNLIKELKTSANSKILNDIPPLILDFLTAIIILSVGFYFLNNTQDILKLVPQLTILAMSFVKILPTINRVSVQFSRLRFSYTSTKNLLLILEEYLVLNQKYEKTKILKLNQEKIYFESIKLKNISYHYNSDHKNVLENINLEIFRGQKVAIIGNTGSGKSTLINIILGLFNNYKGNIYLNENIDLRNEKNKWHGIISFVPQEVYLFDSSVKENIRLNENDNDNKTLKDILSYVKLDKFFDHLPLKYDSIVGERGTNISGGQKQRIGIARALHANSQVMIFDESTNSLDSSTEEFILKNVMSNKDLTVIYITHKKEILKFFDKVYEIKNTNLINA